MSGSRSRPVPPRCASRSTRRVCTASSAATWRSRRTIDRHARAHGHCGSSFSSRAHRRLAHLRAALGGERRARIDAATDRRNHASLATIRARRARRIHSHVRRRAEDASPIVQHMAPPGPRTEYEICSVWPVPEAPPSLYAHFTTDIPTYLISGALDPITPPAFAERALRYLSHGQLTIVAAAGHLASENSPCAPALVERFLEAPYERVDASCTATPVPFVP